MRHDAGGFQKADRPVGERLRRGEAPAQRQLQHEIRPAAHGRLRALKLIEHGGVAALDKVAAHNAQNGAVIPQQAAGLRDLMRVTAVKRIIFGNDARDFLHGGLLCVKSSCLLREKG